MIKRLMLIVAFIAMCVPAAAWAGSGYDGGFYINNDDDSFRITFNGRLQNTFFYERDKDPKLTTGAHRSTLSFRLRKARLDINVKMHDIVSAGFTLQHATSSSENSTFKTVNITGAYA